MTTAQAVSVAPQFIIPTPDGRVFVSVMPQMLTPEAADLLASQLATAATAARGGLVTARSI